MTSDGRWPTKWRPTRTKAAAEDEPLLRSYLGLDDDGPGQLPSAVSPPVRDAVPTAVRPASPMPVFAAPALPSPMAAPDLPPTMTSVMRPPMALASPPAPRATGQRHPAARQRSLMRAVIGDALRVPALLCEFSGCGARYTNPDALGERDLRDWALAAGWQYDVIGRLACPSCVRHAPTFWTRRPQSLSTQGE